MITGGAANLVKILDDSELAENGGAYTLESMTAIRADLVDSGRKVYGGVLPVCPVAQGQIESGQFRLVGGASLPIIDYDDVITDWEPGTRRAIPVYIEGYSPVTPPATQQLDLQVASSNRDGNQIDSGLFGDITSASIQVGDNSNEVVSCFGFTNVSIQQGATIVSAELVITASGSYDAGASTIEGTIYGEAIDNSPVLTTANGNMSTRVNTTSGTPTGGLSAVVLNTEYPFDVTAIIQEIINRPGWASGNALTLIIRNDGSTQSEWQEFHAFDGDPTRSARLEIEYTT